MTLSTGFDFEARYDSMKYSCGAMKTVLQTANCMGWYIKDVKLAILRNSPKCHIMKTLFLFQSKTLQHKI